MKYHRLTVIKRTREGRKTYLYCLCDCGNEVRALESNIKRGRQKSCGCWKNELARQRAAAKRGRKPLCHPDRAHRAYDLCQSCYLKYVWVPKNQAHKTAAAHEYKQRKMQAMPPWILGKSITSIYRAARKVTSETGIPHEVDHIVPLHSPLVCGLHVPWNLRVITAVDNRKKRNHFTLHSYELEVT